MSQAKGKTWAAREMSRIGSEMPIRTQSNTSAAQCNQMKLPFQDERKNLRTGSKAEDGEAKVDEDDHLEHCSDNL